MRRALAGLGLVLAAGPAALAQAPAPPRPVVTPGPPGPHVEDPGRLPEAPPTVPDLVYDSRVLSSAASAEHFQGALDGGWTLRAQGRGDLYAFELVDKRDALEGAWRDLRQRSEPGASGVIDSIDRTSGGLVLRFDSAVVTLKPDLHGRMERGDEILAVELRRAPK